MSNILPTTSSFFSISRPETPMYGLISLPNLSLEQRDLLFVLFAKGTYFPCKWKYQAKQLYLGNPEFNWQEAAQKANIAIQNLVVCRSSTPLQFLCKFNGIFYITNWDTFFSYDLPLSTLDEQIALNVVKGLAENQNMPTIVFDSSVF